MTLHSSHAVLPLALVAGGIVLAVAACGGGSDQPPTSTSSAVASTSAAAPTTAGSPTASTASSRAASPSTSASPSPSAAAGSGSGSCAVGNLKITYANSTGGGGAGSVSGALTFKNTGSASCTLAGFPGVSFVVGGSRGSQVGQAATRTDGAVRTRTLEPGTSVQAALRRTQPGMYGDDCQQTKVDGFRVFPPGSTESAFVAFTTTGCRSASVPLLQVGPVS